MQAHKSSLKDGYLKSKNFSKDSSNINTNSQERRTSENINNGTNDSEMLKTENFQKCKKI